MITTRRQTEIERIFISYSSKNSAIAQSFRTLLEHDGIRCWMAPESIAAGSDYAVDVPDAIRKCAAFVLLLSDEAQESIWVPKELDMALYCGKLIVPIYIEPCKLNDRFKFYLTNIQTTEMFPKNGGDGVRTAVERIK